ncbi:efflux RND transporter periplasmic adaptor subunit, partial [Alcanivorax sp. HI0044]|uniref:efflux RND transporter periplasmic adaptor subunit n=2 Tax=Alcanivorax TaxID=59753 RepID=UPI000ADC568E
AVREAELQLEQASRDLERTRTLFERGTLPQAKFDQAETAYKLRKVALVTAQRNLAYTRILAPFDALVTRRLVDPFTNVPAGAQIVRVQNVEEFRVHINVPENLMATLESPERLMADAIFGNDSEHPLPLKYHEHETEPNSVAQSYRVTFSLARQHEKTILPGMTVTVRVSEASNRPDAM